MKKRMKSVLLFMVLALILAVPFYAVAGQDALTMSRRIAAYQGTDFEYMLVALDDGTVFAYDPSNHPRSRVEDWTDIVAVASGYDHSLGLKKDGTVVATGDNADGECDVEGWKDVIQIAADVDISFGLTKDGRVLLAGYAKLFNRDRVLNWEDVQLLYVDVDAFGITSDGSVLCTNDFYTARLPGVLPPVKAVVCTGNEAYFLTEEGRIWKASELGSLVYQSDEVQNVKQITLDGGYLVTLDRNGKAKSSGSLRAQDEWIDVIVSVSDCIGVTEDGRLLSGEPSYRRVFDTEEIRALRIGLE